MQKPEELDRKCKESGPSYEWMDIEEYIYKAKGSGRNTLRTETIAMPETLRVGDVLASGDELQDDAYDGYNGEVWICVANEDGSNKAWLTVPARLPLALMPEGVGVRVKFYWMHDNHTFTRILGSTLNEILSEVFTFADASPDGMLCSAIVLDGSGNEVRRVGPCVQTSGRNLRMDLFQQWVGEVSQDEAIRHYFSK